MDGPAQTAPRGRAGHSAWLVFSVVLDLLLLLALAVVVLVTITGGTRLHVLGLTVGLRSVGGPLLLAYAVACLRFLLRRRSPFLGLRRFGLEEVDTAAVRVCARAEGWLSALKLRRAAILGAGVIGVSLLLKLVNACLHPGFFSGDDVEIHEMTLGRLYGLDWPVWELRNPFYPLVFIYPVQAALAALGISDTAILVVAGRLVVVAFATATLWLLLRLSGSRYGAGVALLAVVFLGTSRLHVGFGGSELPRPVSTFFVLGAFFCVSGTRRKAAVMLGGALLGVAAAMRFSEALFVVPAMVALLAERRVRDALLVAATASATAALIVGSADALYWGRPFHSLTSALDFTLVKRLSSRGYEPAYQYAATLSSWTNPFTVALALYASRLRLLALASWTWLPVLILSALPHKEPRYLVPVLPFLALSAALGMRHVLQGLQHLDSRRARGLLALALLAGGAGALLYELGGFRLRRSDDAVAFARRLAATAPKGAVAVEQLWRVGGRLYLRTFEGVAELQAGRVTEPNYLASVVSDPTICTVAVLRHTCVFPTCEAALGHEGFHDADLPAATGSPYRVFERRQGTTCGSGATAVPGR